MVSKRLFSCIGLLVILNSLFAQEGITLFAQEGITITAATPEVIQVGDRLQNDTFYVGVDGRFVMSFANDSIIQARFYKVDRFDRYQEIRYRRSGDTVFLHNSTQPRMPYSLCKFESSPDGEGLSGEQVIVSFYSPMKPKEKGVVQEHRLEYVGIYYMDTASRQILIPAHIYRRYSDIIVVHHRAFFSRLCKDIDESSYPAYNYLKIDMSNLYPTCYHALFNEFPLVIKGDSILPVDNGKNYQCWIDNGFFFPKMVKGHGKPWEAKDIVWWRAGLEGSKFEY